MLMPGRWRYASLALFMSIDIAAFTFERLDAALAHLLATLVGAGIGFVWLRRSACIA
jgi:UDP-N-acetylmuramyl pentapeptide phosphotransferase/UDP-N-acetylglucosamine-1-phosphate transferase